MAFLHNPAATRHAGKSALAQFRARRWNALRKGWRDWIALALLALGSLGAAVLMTGTAQLVFTALFGAVIALGIVGWTIGDVHALPWVWGSIAERQTADALEKLDDAWHCEHDVPCGHGNWDHVLVGPAGVFLLETKHTSRRAIVADDVLSAGRIRHNGGRFRAAAAELGEKLELHCRFRPWVQSVVVIWGDFPQQRHEENRVVYLHASELISWLTTQPAKLSADRVRTVGQSIRKLRNGANTSPG